MKKIMLCLVFLSMSLNDIHAQAKQTKVLLEQIAALQVYIGYVQKGYGIAKKGLKAIGDFKRGEFNLHSDYFNSLKIVNPKIRNYVRVGDILSLQQDITDLVDESRLQVQQNDLLDEKERAYLQRAYDRLMENCAANLEFLYSVIADGELEMKDDERMQYIDAIYASMSDDYQFCRSFSKATALLVTARVRENNDVQTSRALHGINND